MCLYDRQIYACDHYDDKLSHACHENEQERDEGCEGKHEYNIKRVMEKCASCKIEARQKAERDRGRSRDEGGSSVSTDT